MDKIRGEVLIHMHPDQQIVAVAADVKGDNGGMWLEECRGFVAPEKKLRDDLY